MEFRLAQCRKVTKLSFTMKFNLYAFSSYLILQIDVTQSWTGIHSTLKGNLRGVVIPLNKVISFFRESLMRRKLNVDRKHSV